MSRLTSYPNVDVYQHGTSQRHTARCECGWQTSVGSLKAAQTLAREHRESSCVGPAPGGRELVPAAPAPVPTTIWNPEQVEIIRQFVAPGCTDDELAFFAQYCVHRQLDPFAGEVVGIMRWDKKANREVMKIQVTVEGLRTIAQRTGLYAGQDEILFCGPDGQWRDVWLGPGLPIAAKAAVYRTDWVRPAPGKAHYAEFVQLDRGGNPIPMWQKMPLNQLAKCAERQALIRAFKEEMRAAGVDVDDLSGPSRISMEARQIGLDDQGRHALVSEVTGGRTESTRDLTEDEVFDVRAEVARRADPETGVITEASAGRAGDTQTDVAQTPSATGATSPRGASRPSGPAEPDAVARTIARGVGDLEERMEKLDPGQVAQIKEWRRAKGLTRPLGTLNTADRARIALELDYRDQCGWVVQPTRPAGDDDAEVVPDDVVEPDLFGDEPF